MALPSSHSSQHRFSFTPGPWHCAQGGPAFNARLLWPLLRAGHSHSSLPPATLRPEFPASPDQTLLRKHSMSGAVDEPLHCVVVQILMHIFIYKCF